MTGRDLVSASLRLIGAVAPGETPQAAELTDGLASINRMISSLSTEGLLIHSITRESFSLVAGTAAYTMGSSGTFNTTRPETILQALIRDESVSPAIEYPVSLLSLSEYAHISAKGVSSALPTALYDDGGYPLRTLTLYPTPSVAHKLVLFTSKALSQITSLDTELSLPSGYEEMLVYNGAIRLAPEYGNTITPEVAEIARESKASVKRANHRPHYLTSEASLISRSGRFNIYTGGNR